MRNSCLRPVFTIFYTRIVCVFFTERFYSIHSISNEIGLLAALTTKALFTRRVIKANHTHAVRFLRAYYSYYSYLVNLVAIDKTASSVVSKFL